MGTRLAGLGLAVLIGFGLPGGAVSGGSSHPSWRPPTLEEVREALDGLDWRSYVDVSYRLYLLRFPETVTRMGMAADLGVRNDLLNDYSDAYVRETMAIEAAILDGLRSIDRGTLSAADHRLFDACEWFWDDLVRAHPFVYCDYPVSHLFVTSVDQQTEGLLLEIHPLVTVADAEDYVLRLEQLGAQLDGVVDALDRRARAGTVLPQRCIDWAVYGIQSVAAGSAAASPYLARLQAALLGIPGLAAMEAEQFVLRAEAALSQTALPAYRRLAAKLTELRATAPEIGIGRAPGGAAYYDYLIRHFTGLEISSDEIHAMGLAEVDRLHLEIRQAAAALGYSATSSISELFDRIQRDGGTLVDEEILDEYERLIDVASIESLEFLSALPVTEVVVASDPIGGFYRSAPRDGSRPATFGAQISGAQPRYTMPTLAYHETIPGHHVQIALAQEMDLPLVLSENHSLGLTEGWALYAERLAWEAGWYETDPYGNLGRLQFEVMRAARLVVDTGLHALGWSYARAASYYAEATGRTPPLVQSDLYRYAVWPGQAVAYGVGLLTLLEWRSAAETALADAFDLRWFHQTLLGFGGSPLGLIGAWMDDAVELRLQQKGAGR